MRDIVEQLAQAIYRADVALAVEGGHDCPYYLRSKARSADEFKSVDGQAAVVTETSLVEYKDLPLAKREEYFAIASTNIQGGVVASDWYERMGVARPATTLAHLRVKETTNEALKAFDAFWADEVKRGKVLMHSNERTGYKALWLAAWAAREDGVMLAELRGSK